MCLRFSSMWTPFGFLDFGSLFIGLISFKSIVAIKAYYINLSSSCPGKNCAAKIMKLKELPILIETPMGLMSPNLVLQMYLEFYMGFVTAKTLQTSCSLEVSSQQE